MAIEMDTRELKRAVRALEVALQEFAAEAKARAAAHYAHTGIPFVAEAETWQQRARAIVTQPPIVARIFGLRQD
jgi:hypothetical protein